MEAEVNALMILANRDFRDEEYNIPRAILSENGIGIKVAAESPDDCYGIGGTIVSPDLTFDEVNSAEFNAIILVGGAGVERYFANELVLGLAKEFAAAAKFVCAICWAPVILARAGLVSGKRIAAWSGAREEIEAAGGLVGGRGVEVDNLIVTADGPDSAEAFGQKIADLLLQN